MFILAGSLAALISYVCNQLVLKRLGNMGILALIPLIEEASKTGILWVLDGLPYLSVLKTGIFSMSAASSIIGTHLIFGLIEGIYDILNSSKRIGGLAALASILSHSIFGLATYLTIRAGYQVYLGVFLAWLIHSTWNWYIMKYL